MIDLEPACGATAELIRRVDDAALDGPTPCSGFTVRDLIEHVDQVARGLDAPAALDDGWRDDVPARILRLATEWADPLAWDGTGPLDLPNATWGRIVLTEIVVHGWDLAVATGQVFAPDERTLSACMDHVAEFVPNAPLTELWGPAVAVPDDAPLLDRVVAVTGRRP